MYLSSGEGVGDIPMRPLERANLNYWETYVSITTAAYTPEISVCQRRIMFSLKYRTMDKAKKKKRGAVILSVIHHRQNPFESKSPNVLGFYHLPSSTNAQMLKSLYSISRNFIDYIKYFQSLSHIFSLLSRLSMVRVMREASIL
jgi:NAD/NADP transhydrogenase alpha subunit